MLSFYTRATVVSLCLLLLTAACGSHDVAIVPIRVSEDAAPTITAREFKFEKRRHEGVAFKLVTGKDPVLTTNLAFYDDAGSQVTFFPLKMTIYTTGLTASLSGTYTTQVKMKGASGKQVLAILGRYKGSKFSGGAMGYGQSIIHIKNSQGVEMRLFSEKAPFFEIDWAKAEVLVTPDDEEPRSWDATLDVPEPVYADF